MPRKSDPSGKKTSKLHVEPAELARKLIKELEGTKVSQGGQTWVRDRYTVFLCREDFARLKSHLDQLVHKLESHMDKHVQNKGYATSGALTVELTMDPDLKPGYFGVLAERSDYEGADQRAGVRAPATQSIWDVPEDAQYDYGAPPMPPASAPLPPNLAAGAAVAGGAAALPSQTPPALGPSYGRPFPTSQDGDPQGPPPLTEQGPAQPGYAPPRMPPAAAVPMPPAAVMPPMPPAAAAASIPAVVGATRTTPAARTPVEPAAEPLVLKVNGQERVFPQGKAVVGRSRDVDVQVDSVEVSRRHAVIYWSEGSVVVKDLGSTNGTMVNGYPVDNTVVRPSDVIRIGDAHITVASR